VSVIERTCDRCAQRTADWETIDECYICADCRAEIVADEAEVEALRQQLRGAVEALRTIALFEARSGVGPSAEAAIARKWLDTAGLTGPLLDEGESVEVVPSERDRYRDALGLLRGYVDADGEGLRIINDALSRQSGDER
jgi:anti-sigma factor RsiW